MTKKVLFVAVLLISAANICNGQKFAIDNGVVRRMVDYSDGHISTKSYLLISTNRDFTGEKSIEFSFTVNDTLYTGESQWKDMNLRDTVGVDGMKGVVLSFRSPERDFSVRLSYLTYPDLALVRKILSIYNTGNADLKIENVNVEDFVLNQSPTETRTYCNFARDMVFGPYTGTWNDPLMVLHESNTDSGIALGNEAISVLKRTEVFAGGNRVKIGLSASGSSMPFCRWIGPGEYWTSPAVFTALYDKNRNHNDIIGKDVQKLVRSYMGTQVEKRPSKPMFVYNTWYPFRHGLDEKLIFDVAHAASECGVQEFVIDDGWQINLRQNREGEYFDDWSIDTVKFPRGLKPVFDSIRALGMKPGLWISIANVYNTSAAYHEHQDWMVRDKEGNVTNIHGFYTCPTACMGTDWADHIRDIILGYVRDYGLAYVKLDLAIATSAYIYDDSHSGCYCTEHKYHRGHSDSYSVIFDRCMEMFDSLHKAAPELYIDCTFETAGKLHLMDYGIARHADGNWLSNIEAGFPNGALKMRNLAWRRTPVLSASSLVIGNLRMEGPGHIHSLKSLAGTLPIMLGDPRNLSTEERKEYRMWTDWLKELQNRHSYMSFRQDLTGFGEPCFGAWDGFARINTDTKSGGLVGVFREDAADSIRTVTVNGLDPKAMYAIKRGYTGETISEITGESLSRDGFKVEIHDRIGGELFEIIRL